MKKRKFVFDNLRRHLLLHRLSFAAFFVEHLFPSTFDVFILSFERIDRKKQMVERIKPEKNFRPAA